jgi:NadR type nicotinamide-nucleotide adenylyltransferase
METIKKFVVIGPESTGKSTLCSQLAEHYHTTWVPEYAREYLEKNGMDYSYEDLLIIAKRQIELEESFGKLRLNSQLTTHSSQLTTHSSELLIIDTDMYVMKVWCEYVFDKCHNWVLNRIAERNYDGYLLCNADLPWIKDNLREYPDVETRNKLYHFYKDIMVNQSLPWIDISGSYEERFEKAVNFIEKELDV